MYDINKNIHQQHISLLVEGAFNLLPPCKLQNFHMQFLTYIQCTLMCAFYTNIAG